jgi:hypothetical protein
VRLLFRKRSVMTPYLEACLSGGGRIGQVFRRGLRDVR